LCYHIRCTIVVHWAYCALFALYAAGCAYTVSCGYGGLRQLLPLLGQLSVNKNER
jgi:hypothetical protein